jgi:hypothetical protein
VALIAERKRGNTPPGARPDIVTTTTAVVATEANNIKFTLKKVIKDLKTQLEQKDFE